MNNPAWSTQVAGAVREMLREQVEYRELLATIVRRDLMLRYKQTVMGFGWAVFMPLLNTIIFSVIFMRVAPSRRRCRTRSSPSAACWPGTSSPRRCGSPSSR